MDKSVAICVEYLDYRRAEGRSLRKIVEDIKEADDWQVGWPDEMTPDSITLWLAEIYEAYLMLPLEDG